MTQEEILGKIVEICKVNKVQEAILFGSRARGDYHRASDIDLAVYGGDVISFSLDVEEYTSTLLTYDVIDMNKNHQVGLIESIEKEGRVIYEKI